MTITINNQGIQPDRPGKRSGWRLLTILLCAALLSACASTPSQDIEIDQAEQREMFEQAHHAYRNFKYTRAINLLNALAKQGYTDAQYALGYMYYYGFGVSQDEQLAIEWIKRAAASGHTKAITALDRIKVVREYEQKKKQLNEAGADKQSMNEAAEGADLHTRLMMQAETIAPESEADQTVLPSNEEIPPSAMIITPDSGTSEQVSEQPAAGQTETDTAETAHAAASDAQGLQWLKQQNPEHYTIQLVSGRKEQRIRSYIKAHGLDAQTTLVTLQREDEAPYHIALYGIFPSVAEASQALQALPEPILEAQPWVRGIDQVLAEFK